MTVVLPQLPAPGGSPQEVLFRRMLLQCTQRVQQPAHTDGGKDWRSDAKFHCIIEALQEKLYDLEHAAPDQQPGPDVLALYRTAVRSITSQLQQPELPAYCLRVSAHDRVAGGTRNSSSTALGGSRQQQAHRTSGEQQQQHLQDSQSAAEQQPSTVNNAAAASYLATAAAAASNSNGQPSTSGRDPASNSSSGPGFSLSAHAQQSLSTQQRLQDDLTDELLEMGSELKSSTLAMQNAIRYRGKLLDDTETHLVHSTENAKAVAAKAKEQYRQGNWNLCHTCIIVLSVFVIFTVMLVAIRVSSLVGLKGS